MSAVEIQCPKCIKEKIDYSTVGELYCHELDGSTLKIEGCIYCHFHGIQMIDEEDKT